MICTRSCAVIEKRQGSKGAADVTGLMILKGPDVQHRRGLLLVAFTRYFVACLLGSSAGLT